MCIQILVIIAGLLQLAAGCGGDNCANHVTGSWGGIGAPLASRVSMCNSFLRTTISLPATTVTTTIHRYTTNMPTEVTTALPVTTFRNTTSEYPGSGNDSSIVPTSVPTFATLECPAAGQFSSACKCWASVTAHNTTAPAPTRTATTTVWHNVACGPAATGVFPGNGTYFPCSRQWGMCSCLKSGDDDVCVRVGPLVSNGWQNMTGPCGEFDECGVDESCPGEQVCVYDGSCRCGKKRCYRAAPRGCEYQDLPIDEWESKLHQRRDGIAK